MVAFAGDADIGFAEPDRSLAPSRFSKIPHSQVAGRLKRCSNLSGGGPTLGTAAKGFRARQFNMATTVAVTTISQIARRHIDLTYLIFE